ncbi:serine hydrolase domain-containing protein [Rufibacter psychrotolerans]|uniref:serine hydrolase domain-containing protein n=1 Tax=Rufibacter psychrotolerans TaxID=2812556 RepID=UPI0019682D1C|nr:serine hydrolase domain-containing protein [Rufibacter sp. SYSU D00308]
MKRFYWGLLLFFLWGTLAVEAQTTAKTTFLKQRLQARLDSLQKANGFPGVTFAAVLPSGEMIQLAAGLADSVRKEPMKPGHRMLSGSNGKTLFLASALILEKQGVFRLDDKIEQYLATEPWFSRLPNARTITLRQLMNHTSGLEEYYELGDFMQKVKQNPARTFTPLECFSYLFDRKPLFPAGTSFGYADTNYLLLGYILEKISGKKLYDVAREQIIKPYQLTKTEPSIKQSFWDLAVGYSRAGGPFPFSGAMVQNGKLVFNPQFEWVGGGFVSNAADLATWAKGFYHFKPVSEDIRAQMRQGVKANTGKDHLYGLGMQIRPSPGFGFGYGHSGWFPGYISDGEYFPDLDLALGIQFNTDDLRLLKKSTHAYLLELTQLIVQQL